MIKSNSMIFFIVTLFSIYTFNSCVNKAVNEGDKKQFEKFYSEFHENSQFQLERITFPLKGYNYDYSYNPMDSIDSNFNWLKDDWNIHSKPIESDSLIVKRQYKKDTVEEIITVPNSGIEIVRKFSLINDKWYLVFYGNQSL